jgi:hypothetical protein
VTDYNLRFFLLYNAMYNQVSRDDIAAQGVTWSRGVNAELEPEKGTFALRLNDATDQYRPSNPSGPLYGIIGPYVAYAYLETNAPRSAGSLEILTPDRTDSHRESAGVTVRGNRWVDVKATDPIGELGRWREVVLSPMRGFISALPTLTDYWPGEDGAGSSVLSAVKGTSGVPTAVTFAASDGPSGSNRVLTIGTGGRLRGKFSASLSTSSWQISFASDMDGADGTERPVFTWTTSQGWTWTWKASTTTYRLVVTDQTGATLLDWGQGGGGVNPGDKVLFVFKAHRSGSTWTAETWWWEEGAPVLWGGTNTFSGGTGRPTTWTTYENTVMNGAYFAHLFAVSTQADDILSYNALHAAGGFPDERTEDRFERVCEQRAIPAEVLGTANWSTPMGPQRPGTTKNQLLEIARTEQGLIFGSRSGRGLKFATRNYLTAQAAAPALELTAPDDCNPREVVSAADLFNTVTAENRSGESATRVETEGKYGTADPPAGSGVVDKTVTVNVATYSDLEQAANQWLRFYQQTARVGEITVDLDRSPSLRTDVDAIDVGQFIRLTGATPDPLLLLVIGISGRERLKGSEITFTTIPGDMWALGTWDGPSRWQLRSSTVKTAATSTATSITLKQTEDEAWSTAAGYDLMIGGERVSVTAMGARTGTPGDWQQVATVTRSVNGVVKAQTVGTAVRVVGAGRWGRS